MLITVGYSAPQRIDVAEVEKSIVNMYVGISLDIV